MNTRSHVNFLPFASSRRAFVAGTTAVVGATALGVGLPSVLGQTMRTRMDIAAFGQDVTRLAKFEAAVKENLKYLNAIKKSVKSIARKKKADELIEKITIETRGKSLV